MSRAQELLDAATPLPWEWGPDIAGAYWIKADGMLAFAYTKADRDLILRAVNRLPAYEAAVEALERLTGQVISQPDQAKRLWEQGRAALAALRDEVPA